MSASEEQETESWYYCRYYAYIGFSEIKDKDKVLEMIYNDSEEMAEDCDCIQVKYTFKGITMVHPTYGMNCVIIRTIKKHNISDDNKLIINFSGSDKAMDGLLLDKFYVDSKDIDDKQKCENIADFLNDALGLKSQAIKSADKR